MGPLRGVYGRCDQERAAEGGNHMLAALNMGLIGTIIVVALVIAVVLFFMRRA